MLSEQTSQLMNSRPVDEPTLRRTDSGSTAAERQNDISDLEAGPYGVKEKLRPLTPLPGKQQENSEKAATDIVDWDGPDDAANPLNKSNVHKWLIIVVVGSATICVTCASSIASSTYRGMQQDFHISQEIATLSVSIFIAGLGLGPLVLAPLSEFYGRSPIYIYGYLFYSAFGFMSAFGNFPGLLVGRFIQGVAGSAFLSVAGGSVTDMWAGNKVGRPMAVYTAFPFTGPILGPLFGAWINLRVHWRWTYYFMTIWSFSELLLLFFFVPETFAPVLLKKKARKLRNESGNTKLRSKKELEEDAMENSNAMYVFKSIGRPFEILFTEPMAFLLCLWCAMLLGILYSFFGAFAIIFSRKGFNEGDIGLSFIGIGTGIVIATLINATIFNQIYAGTAKRLGRKPPPEEHLKKGMVAAIMGPISLFWFAWTSQPSVHWAVPVVASVFFGMTFTFAFTASFTYLVDAYRPYAASAMGANSFLRASFAAGFPLFIDQMYDKLGVTWAGSLIAFLLLVMAPFPFLFFRYGERLRQRSKFSDRT